MHNLGVFRSLIQPLWEVQPKRCVEQVASLYTQKEAVCYWVKRLSLQIIIFTVQKLTNNFTLGVSEEGIQLYTLKGKEKLKNGGFMMTGYGIQPVFMAKGEQQTQTAKLLLKRARWAKGRHLKEVTAQLCSTCSRMKAQHGRLHGHRFSKISVKNDAEDGCRAKPWQARQWRLRERPRTTHAQLAQWPSWDGY